MKNVEVVFSTATWARTKKEKEIIEATLLALSRYGFPIVITDKKSSKFPVDKNILKGPIYNIYRVSGSFFRQKKKSFTEASKLGKYVFWLESDKLDFVKNNIKDILRVLKNRRRNDIVLVPSQDKKSFLKYPKFQQVVEKSISFILSDALKLDGIFTYGPIVFPSSFVKALKNVKGKKLGWGINALLFFSAFIKKIPIIVIPLKIIPPPDVQKDGNLKLFRLEQLESYILAIKEGIKLFKMEK